MSLTQVKEILEKFERDFDPEAVPGLEAVIQYNIKGSDGGNWTIEIKDNQCAITPGIHDQPTVAFQMNGPTWLGLVNKTLNPMVAFTTGRVKITGDKAVGQLIPKIFKV